MSAGKSSAVSAVASDVGCSAAHTPSPAGDEQGDLLRSFADELVAFEDQTIPPPKRRGRPPGSPNRSTTQVRKLLLQSGYRDPAEFLAAIVSRGTRDLASALDCDPIEAAKLQRQAATDLMPYFHQRMPQEADAKPAEARPLVVILEGSARVGMAADDGTLSVYDAEQFQRVSDAETNKSHDDTSHDEG